MSLKTRVEEAIPELSSIVVDYWEVAPAGIYFVDPGQRRVRLFNPATRRTTDRARLTTAPESFNSGFSVAPNGRRFLYVRYDSVRQEILLVSLPK